MKHLTHQFSKFILNTRHLSMMTTSFINEANTESMNLLLENIREKGVKKTEGKNLIAFSGGVDSSVVAAAVYHEFPENTSAVLGISAALPLSQLHLARQVATSIGIPLIEFQTQEGEKDMYIANEGMSCYACKTELYNSLIQVHKYISENMTTNSNNNSSNITNTSHTNNIVRLFNGTNKEDLSDPTRVGLQAAAEFEVLSPLQYFDKNIVRSFARDFNLPNHAHAASPCLRSRLAFGVKATSKNLQRVERAEELVRMQLTAHGVPLRDDHNLRVRHLPDDTARIELDSDLMAMQQTTDVLALLAQQIAEVEGFPKVVFKEFKSGGVAKHL